MKLEEMSNMDLAYIEGFIKACADKGVDPELFLESLTKPAQAAPDYESRRRNVNLAVGGTGAGAYGALAGGMAGALKGRPGAGALIGAAGGTALGAGAAAAYNALRKYLGFSAMGVPVTAKAAADGELSKPMPGGSKKEKKEEAPDYEKRRRGMAIGLGSLGGALTGAQAGAMSANPFKGSGEQGKRALIGGVAGAGLGAGAAAIYNAIRKYMGFSAFGTPVTLGKDVQ